jgi:hypothetical protein
VIIRYWAFPPGTLSYFNYWFLKNGLTQDEVVALLGPGRELRLGPGRELQGAGPCKPDGTSLVAGSRVFLWTSGGTFLDDIVIGFEKNTVVDIYARDTMWYEALPGIGGIAVGAVIAGGGLLLILFLWRFASNRCQK